MATVIRKAGSPHWFARYRVEGQDITRSTKTGNRRAAERKMREWMAADRGTVDVEASFRAIVETLQQREQDSSDDPQMLIELRGLRRRMASEILQGIASRLELDDAWGAWRDSPRKRDPNETTMDAYEGAWLKFKQWATRRKVKWMHEVSPSLAEDYCRHLKSGKFAPRTYNGHVKLLRSVFKTLRLRAGIAENPFADILLMEAAPESRRALTEEEIRTVVSRAKGSMRVMIAVGIFTGLRLGDVCRLRWSNIDLPRGTISLVPGKTARRGKKIAVPIHPALSAILTEWQIHAPKNQDRLFPKECALYEERPSKVAKLFQDFFKDDCGLVTTEEAKHRKIAIIRVGFHSLRHSFVSLCAASGVPQHVVQTLVGHGSPAMTEHYTHVDADQKRRAIAALPALEPTPPEKVSA